MKIKTVLLSLMALLTFQVQGQDSIPLWPSGVPNSNGKALTESHVRGKDGVVRVKGVSVPTLHIYKPEPSLANGTSVIICPGGGYYILAFEHEGTDLAKWFNSFGVTAFVLKYRLPGDGAFEDTKIGPLQDAQKALLTVREGAEKWGVDPDRVGILGFSAGGHLASTVLTHYADPVIEHPEKISFRPDFGVLIYPVVSMNKPFMHKGSRNVLIGKDAPAALAKRFSAEEQVDAGTPTTFLVHSSDDKAVPVQNSVTFYQRLIDHGVPAEMHIFETGGHGYGMGRGTSHTKSWPESLKKWMDAKGWLQKQ